MTTDSKVQIGLSTDYLEGTAVTTPAGANLFREGVVLSDPDNAQGRANVRDLNTQLLTTDKGIVTNTVIHGKTTGGGGGFVDVKVNPSGALNADVTGSLIQDSTDVEYIPVATTITASGDNTVYTPATGKSVRLHWVYAINDPLAATSTKITIKMGAVTYYVAWAISKRQQFTGAVNAPLVVNLSATGNVAFTAFIEEV